MNIPFKLNLFYVSKSFITGLTFFLAIALTKTAGAEVPAGPLSAESFTRHVEEQHSSKPDYRQNGASLISLSVKNASLREIAAALTKMSGKNVIADTKVQEPVTLQLENVSLHTALETLAAVQGLTYTENGSVGKLAADAGSNSLLFNGSPAEARKIKEALQTLDKTAQQVTLEAKILSISKSDEKNLGIQWNWDTLPQYNKEEHDNTASPGNSAANTAGKGHLRLWRGTGAQFQFSATLNALITSGKAKVLATPSLITLPGKEASIFIGSHIPVITEKHNNGESTYSTEYVDAGIKLKYTPIVSDDGYITSAVHTEVSTPTLISELKNYRINSRTADTNVRMRNGETLVIGGLISEEEQKQLQQIPFLSKIPLLGFLFKNHYRSKSKTEVIMLLTPYLSDAGTSPAIYGSGEAALRKTADRY